jgi:hypothetical protein
MTMTTKTKLPAVAIVLIVAMCAGAAHAAVSKPGGTSVKNPGFHGPLHGPGSTHNPIVRHPPLHGPGSSHNPIVVPPNCNDPNTLCRRP